MGFSHYLGNNSLREEFMKSLLVCCVLEHVMKVGKTLWVSCCHPENVEITLQSELGFVNETRHRKSQLD